MAAVAPYTYQKKLLFAETSFQFRVASLFELVIHNASTRKSSQSREMSKFELVTDESNEHPCQVGVEIV